MDISHTLNERGNTHGKFEDNSRISQSLKRLVGQTRNYGLLDDVQREALDMILHKLSRMLAGDPNYIDTVRDIAGYAQLLVEHLEQKAGATDCTVTKYTITGG